jgi:hypothetical protein
MNIQTRSMSRLKRTISQNPMDEPSSSKPRLGAVPGGDAIDDAALQFVHDDLDDATHADFDTAVLHHFEGKIVSDFNFFFAALLLTVIVLTSEGPLNSEYKNPFNAMALLEKQPALLRKLKACWDTGTFREIRNLSETVYIELTTPQNLCI